MSTSSSVSTGAAPTHAVSNGSLPKAGLFALTLGAIGVVYGDIGTSPLYAIREAVNAAIGGGDTATREAVLGVLSLIIWSLIVVVTLKYVFILLNADNHGEGGTLALMALALRALPARGRSFSYLASPEPDCFTGTRSSPPLYRCCPPSRG